MFNESDEERNRRIRKRKVRRLNSSDSRSKLKADLKTAVKHRDYGISRESTQTNRCDEDFYDWLDREETTPGSYGPMC